jgi:hypothetical protein
MDKPPADSADHAQDFARRYAQPLDQYCTLRMEELGVPDDKSARTIYLLT